MHRGRCSVERIGLLAFATLNIKFETLFAPRATQIQFWRTALKK